MGCEDDGHVPDRNSRQECDTSRDEENRAHVVVPSRRPQGRAARKSMLQVKAPQIFVMPRHTGIFRLNDATRRQITMYRETVGDRLIKIDEATTEKIPRCEL